MRNACNIASVFSACYALDVRAKSKEDAIAAASKKFYRLSLADRADAIICDGSLDYFEAEEVRS